MAQTKVKLISDGVIDVNHLASGHGITTDNIGEGSNLYYTDARVSTYLSTNNYATEGWVNTNYLALSGGTLTGGLNIQKTTLADAIVGFQNYTDVNPNYGSIGINTSGYLQIHSSNGIMFRGGLYYFEHMRLDSSGNLGIGTTSPIDKLHVSGGITSTNISAPSNTSIGSLQIGYDGTNGVIRTWNSSPLLFSAYNYHRFDVSGSPAMTISTSRNIGIGVENDIRAKLHINSENVVPNTNAPQDGSNFIISGVDGNMDLFSTDDNSSVSNSIGFGRYNASTGALIHKFGIVSWANTGSTGSNTGDKISFHYGGNKNAWSNSELLTIKSGGDVGIGTSNINFSTTNRRVLEINGTSEALLSFATNGSWQYYIHALASGVFHATGGKNFIVDPGAGSIGLGTTSPSNAKVHIVGTGSYVGNYGYNTLTLEDASGYPGLNWRQGNSNWLFRKNGQTQELELLYSSNASAPATGTYNKWINIGTDGVFETINYVRAKGVRIGRDFSIANRATVRLDSVNTSSPSDILFGHTAAANQTSWDGVYWSLSSRGSSAGNKFYFYRGSGQPAPNNSEAILMSFDPAMRVGIGEESPGAKLSVKSSDTLVSDFYSPVSDQLTYLRVWNTAQSSAGTSTAAAAIELVGKADTSTHGRHAWIGAEGVNGTTYATQVKFKVRGSVAYNWDGSYEAPTRMVIDGRGYVTKDAQPYFNVQIGTSAVTVNSDAKLPFTVVSWDIGSNFSTANSRFTCPVAGRYLFALTSSIQQALSGDYNAMYIRVNNIGTSFRFRTGPTSSGVWTGITGSAILNLSAGDYVEIWAYTHSGSMTLQPNETILTGYLLG